MYHLVLSYKEAGKSGLCSAYPLLREEVQEYVGSRPIMRVMLCAYQNGIAKVRKEAVSLQLPTCRK